MKTDPFAPADVAVWLALLNLTRLNPLSAQDFAERETQRSQDEFLQRHLGRIGNETVAIGQLAVAPYAPMDHLALLVCTAPTWRGRGCGTAMLSHLEEIAVARGYAGLSATLSEMAQHELAWMLGRGFVQYARRFDGLLDLDRLRLAQAETTLPPGLRLQDMSGANDADWHQVYDLFAALLADTPDMRGLPQWSRDRCEAVLRRSPGSRDYWVIVALAEHTPVGLTVGHAMGAEVYSFFTGVVSGLRGRGIGLALKRQLIVAAQRCGAVRMRTTNLEQNIPALRLNAALGFSQVPGSVEVRKRL